MTIEEALEKAAKLLRLATSTNPHEAALAASRAQEIMDRFKLSADAVSGAGGEVRSNEPIKDFADDRMDAGSKLDRWRGQLAMAVCAVNQCQCYRSHKGGGVGLSLIGRASDVSTVRYLYSWLTREIERLAARDCAGYGRTYWNNYRIGAVETITRRLRESAKATVEAVKAEALESGGERALIVVEQSALALQKRAEEVEQWTRANLRLRSGGSYRTTYNGSAREAGRRAGGEVRLNGARGAIAGSRFALA